ncbi:MAG: tetratricopeptide repeat protein [Verrucomicrobiota bacterium]|jgi:tetratricopeptide (TPR) repeat protein
MSQSPKEKAPAVHSSAPASPASDMPGMADSRLPESECRPVGLNDRWMVCGVCIFLAAITFAVFGQTLRHDFVNYDDDKYVYENSAVLKGGSLQGIIWAFTHIVNFNWTPLTVISHMLDCQLYGTEAAGHHLTNVILHMASVIVLFLVLRGMTVALWRSAFVAAVFAIHPLHVESVAWIAERRDVLSGLFFMLTLAAYAGYVRHQWSLGRYLMVALMLVLALMSKPMVVTLPFVLILLDYWPLKRFDQPCGCLIRWHLILEKLPLLALSGATCAATLFAQKEAIPSLPPSWRFGNALVSYVTYLRQMIYPAGLAVYYPHPEDSLALWNIIISLVLLLAISTAAIATRRNQPWFLFGWLWYLGMLVPAIGLIQSGLRAQANRYTYLPQIGLYVLLTWAVADLCAGWRHRRWVLGGCATVILVALIFCARTQAAYWRNSETLWTHTLACTSDNAIGQYNLGNALLKNGSVDEAISHFQKALQIIPDNAEVCYSLGGALLKKGNAGEAIAHFQKALAISTNEADIHYIGIALAKAHGDYANTLVRMGRDDEAMVEFRKALELLPDFADARQGLALILLHKGRVDEAIVQLRKIWEQYPDKAMASFDLGNAYFQKGQMDEAMAFYQRALQIEPDDVSALNNLGMAFLTKGMVDEAIVQFRAALALQPDFALARTNLAKALLQKEHP